MKVRNLKPVSLFFFFFFALLHVERFSSKHVALGVDVPHARKMYCLQMRPYIFQPGNVTGWGSEGVKTGFIKEEPNRRRQMAENVEHVQLLPSVNLTSLFYAKEAQ